MHAPHAYMRAHLHLLQQRALGYEGLEVLLQLELCQVARVAGIKQHELQLLRVQAARARVRVRGQAQGAWAAARHLGQLAPLAIDCIEERDPRYAAKLGTEMQPSPSCAQRARREGGVGRVGGRQGDPA